MNLKKTTDAEQRQTELKCDHGRGAGTKPARPATNLSFYIH